MQNEDGCVVCLWLNHSELNSISAPGVNPLKITQTLHLRLPYMLELQHSKQCQWLSKSGLRPTGVAR